MKIELKKWSIEDKESLIRICNTIDRNYLSDRLPNPYTKEVEAEILEALKPAYIQGFSLLGGEPFEPENQKELAGLLQKIKESYPEKNVWCYTGYLYDVDLIPGGKVYTEYTDKMLACIDTLVDGEFIEAEKDLTLEFRGSRNQRILHLDEIRQNAKN